MKNALRDDKRFERHGINNTRWLGIGTLVGRGALFFVEAFLGARYGAAAKQFLVTQKWSSVALALGLVLVFLAIRRLPVFRQTEVSQAD